MTSFRSAIKWSYVAQGIDQGLNALFTFVFAFLLGPKDFGTVAMAMAYITFIKMFLEQGLVPALIQKKDLRPEHLDSVFCLNLLMSVALATLSVGLSGWWGTMNHLPALAPVISVLSLSIPFEGLTIVQKAVLQRDLDFRSFSIRTIIATSTGGLLGLIVAFAGYGVWALITKQIISDLVGLMVLWRLSRWRPHLRLSVAAIRQLLGFSLAGFAGNIGLYFNAQSDALLIGLFFGPVSVGLYRLASRVTSSVITATTSSLQVASFPQFCKLQDKPDELRKSVLSCFRVSSIVTIPALVGIAAISKWLMLAMGPKWVDASTGVVILCVVGILQQPVYFVGTFLQAIAKPHYLAVIEWAHAAVSAGSLLAASILLKDQVVSVQVTGIAITRLITTVLFLLPLLIYVLRKYARITVSAAMQVMRPSLLAATATGLAVVLITLAGLLQNFKLWTAIAIQVALGGAAGVAVLLWLDNALRNAVDDLVRRMRRQAAPAGTTGSGIGCNAAEVNR